MMPLIVKLRPIASELLRKHRWLPPAATIIVAAWVVLALVENWPLMAFIGAVALAVAAYVWGYAARAFRTFDWAPLLHLPRRQYAQVWDTLAASPREARAAACGLPDEEKLKQSAEVVHQRIAELVGIRAEDDILEIGCGVGRIGLGLAARCRSWTGADISANMLACAAERLRDVRNVRLVQLHSFGLAELQPESFDLVYCTNVFAHLDEMDRWRYVQEGFRVLRPGGRVLVDNVALDSDEGWASFERGVRAAQEFERPPYNPRPSTAGELMAYARGAGFEQVRSHQRPPLVVVTGIKPLRAA